tara:strand:- start:1571 stop:1843 length:273 start_codon:yes stop_codon:yes gene_type:complete
VGAPLLPRTVDQVTDFQRIKTSATELLLILAESDYGHRDKRGHYKPHERVSYPPVFVWPLKPVGTFKWVFAIPGYFVSWNLFYALAGLLT